MSFLVTLLWTALAWIWTQLATSIFWANNYKLSQLGLENTTSETLQRGKTSPRVLGNVEYPFIPITPRSILTLCGSTC